MADDQPYTLSDEIADFVAQFAVQTNPYGLSISIDRAQEFADALLASPIIASVRSEAHDEGYRQAREEAAVKPGGGNSDSTWATSTTVVYDGPDEKNDLTTIEGLRRELATREGVERVRLALEKAQVDKNALTEQNAVIEAIGVIEPEVIDTWGTMQFTPEQTNEIGLIIRGTDWQ